MSEYRVASRYSKSLITLAQEKGILEEIHRDMLSFSKICRENREFVLMLKNPIINNDKKSGILKTLFEGKLHQMTMSFFGIITQKNREMLLPIIAEEFHHQYNEIQGISMAEVTTVFPLDQTLRDEFKNLIGTYTKATEVELDEVVNEDLIGGYLLKLEGKQVDQSLKGKLKELSLKFS